MRFRKPENTKKTSAEEKTWSITQTETAISVGMEGNGLLQMNAEVKQPADMSV